MNMIEVRDLCVSLKKKTGDHLIIKNVSFSVKAGECLGILGESGSGKSMTVKAFTGLLDQNFAITGRALFHGQDLLQQRKEALRRLRGRQIAMVLQNPMTCFDPLYRIGSQIAETFTAHTDWDNARIREESIRLLEQMQLRDPAEVLEKYPHQLSGGMLQRIMIGIALAMQPELLIADEPTTAIDAITQFEILQEFRKIKADQKTAMLFISHDLGAVSQVADRILVMNNGSVVDEGDFSHILHHACDPYTRLLVEKRSAVMGRYRSVLRGEVAV